MRLNRLFGLIALSIVPLTVYTGGCGTSSTSSNAPDSGSGGSSSGGTPDSGGSSSSSSSGGTMMEACSAPCQTACATELCATTPANAMPGDACDMCFQSAINMGGACSSAVQTACAGDPDCLALFGPNGCNAGCAATMDAGPPPGDGGGEAGAGGDAGGPSDAGGGEAGGGDAGGDKACHMAASKAACENCCLMGHMHGYQTVLNAALACGCCH